MHFDIQIFFFDINDLKIILAYFSFDKSKMNICLFQLFFMSQTNSITKSSLACTLYACPHGHIIEYAATTARATHRVLYGATPSNYGPQCLTFNFQRSMRNAIWVRCRYPSFPDEHILFPKRSLKIEAELYLYYTIIVLYNMSSEVVKP
ncbi:unnamed protein product [Aphis gossypii]|uniref:Uncharacterized protein n=1 Tax=Aphis gossypii TaxID=80765 RepID=A0A9P0J1A0_APHGO|nr:unnamed protein product [Aphis gossypii]